MGLNLTCISGNWVSFVVSLTKTTAKWASNPLENASQDFSNCYHGANRSDGKIYKSKVHFFHFSFNFFKCIYRISVKLKALLKFLHFLRSPPPPPFFALSQLFLLLSNCFYFVPKNFCSFASLKAEILWVGLEVKSMGQSEACANFDLCS